MRRISSGYCPEFSDHASTVAGLMKKQILIYGLFGGVLIVLLKLIEYRFLVIEHSIEIYSGLVALLFAVLGLEYLAAIT